jgi:hypothetical protein
VYLRGLGFPLFFALFFRNGIKQEKHLRNGDFGE